MSKKAKLFRKFLEKPPRKDLTYQELESLLLSIGYKKLEGEGSRARQYLEGLYCKGNPKDIKEFYR